MSHIHTLVGQFFKVFFFLHSWAVCLLLPPLSFCATLASWQRQNDLDKLHKTARHTFEAMNVNVFDNHVMYYDTLHLIIK